MARCPFAQQRILPENATQSRITPRSVILHTAVDGPGPTDLAAYFGQVKVKAESHFYVTLNGTIVQMMDTTVEADANAIADKWAISIETEDDSARRGSDILPWSDAQIKALVRLVTWCCDTHRIPKRRCTGPRLPAAEGIGYHSQPMRERWAGQVRGVWQNPWTGFQGKTCPGDARVRQYPSIVAAVAGSSVPQEEDDMEYKDWSQESKEAFWNDAKIFLAPVITGSAVASPKDKQTNLGDLANLISQK